MSYREYNVDKYTAIGLPMALATAAQKWDEWDKANPGKTEQERIAKAREEAHRAIDGDKFLGAAGTRELVTNYTDMLFDSPQSQPLEYMKRAAKAMEGRDVQKDIDAALSGNVMKLINVNAVRQSFSDAAGEHLGMRGVSYLDHFQNAVRANGGSNAVTQERGAGGEHPKDVAIAPDPVAVEDLSRPVMNPPLMQGMLLLISLLTGMDLSGGGERRTSVVNTNPQGHQRPVSTQRSPSEQTVRDMLPAARRLAAGGQEDAQRAQDVESVRTGAVKLVGGEPGNGSAPAVTEAQAKALGNQVLDGVLDAVLVGGKDRELGAAVLQALDKTRAPQQRGPTSLPQLEAGVAGMALGALDPSIGAMIRAVSMAVHLAGSLPLKPSDKTLASTAPRKP